MLSRCQPLLFKTGSSLPFAQRLRAMSTHKDWVGLQNDQDFFKKNEKLSRPMSPHITEYKFPLPAMLSVLHRGTGLFMSLTVSTAALVLAGGGHDLAWYISAVQALNIPSPVIFAGKAALAFPLTYHASNGIRHLIWDTGRNLNTVPDVYKSAYIVLGTGAILAGAIALL